VITIEYCNQNLFNSCLTPTIEVEDNPPTGDCKFWIYSALIIRSKIPWAVSYLTTNFGGPSPKIYACFERKRFL